MIYSNLDLILESGGQMEGMCSYTHLEKGEGEISCKYSTERNIRKVFYERGIMFKLNDEGFPYVEYDPKKDIIPKSKD